MTGTGRKPDKSSRTGRDVDPTGQIAGKLKSLYDSVESEPIPHMFLSLLEKLDEAERKAKP